MTKAQARTEASRRWSQRGEFGSTPQVCLRAKKHVNRCMVGYLRWKDAKRDGNVRGMLGASPYADTWHAYLKTVADVTAARLTVECVEMERRSHAEGLHAKPVPKWPCALTNSRAYCLECNPQQPLFKESCP